MHQSVFVLTYKIIGSTQVIVPYSDLQRLTDQFCERNLIKELLSGKSRRKMMKVTILNPQINNAVGIQWQHAVESEFCGWLFGVTERPCIGLQPLSSWEDSKWKLRALVPDYTMEKSSVGDYCENRNVPLSLPDDTHTRQTPTHTRQTVIGNRDEWVEEKWQKRLDCQ